MPNDLEKELLQVLSDLHAEREKAFVRLQVEQDAVNGYDEQIRSVQDTLDIIRGRPDRGSKEVDEVIRDRLHNKTTREILTELAQDTSPPTFRVSEMARVLVRGGMYDDLESARNSIYSCVGRNERYFAKLGSGYYLATPERGPQRRQAANAKKRSRKESTGLRDRILHLRQEHPEWTERDFRIQLERESWDFGASQPHKAVHGVFMGLKQSSAGDSQAPLIRSVS